MGQEVEKEKEHLTTSQGFIAGWYPGQGRRRLRSKRLRASLVHLPSLYKTRKNSRNTNTPHKNTYIQHLSNKVPLKVSKVNFPKHTICNFRPLGVSQIKQQQRWWSCDEQGIMGVCGQLCSGFIRSRILRRGFLLSKTKETG